MDKKKITIVGTGLRSLFFIDELAGREDCELAALCDRYPSRTAAVADQLGRPEIPQFTNIEECLDAVKCDAVINCTSDGSHAETTVPALKRGEFVYLEKPLGITKDQCEAVIAADRAAGGRTYVGLNLRHAPLYRKIKELIDSNVLGRILTIQADEFYHGGRTYFRRWNRLREFGGGLWITKACHDFDLLYWFAGGRPESVSAFAHLSVYKPDDRYPGYCGECSIRETCPDVFDEKSISPRSLAVTKAAVEDGMERPDLCLFNSDKDTFDHGAATVNFDNDVVATYTVSVVAGFTNRRIRVCGTKASLDGDLESQQIGIHYLNPMHSETITAAEGSDGHGGADGNLVPSFFGFMDGEVKPPVTPEEAMVSVMIGLAATESGDTEETVRLQ